MGNLVEESCCHEKRGNALFIESLVQFLQGKHHFSFNPHQTPSIQQGSPYLESRSIKGNVRELGNTL